MSTPPSEEESSTLTITETLELNQRSESLEIETLLEKQLLMEKTRVGQLTNDNQRLISQNISLCQAIKKQKLEMDTVIAQNDTLKQQVSKLYLTLTTVNKTQQQNSVKEAEIQKALKQEFDVLKEGLTQRDAQIISLQDTNQKLSITINSNTKQLKKRCDELDELQNKYESEKSEYEKTIQTHLDSIHEFNSTINTLQSAMDDKEKELHALKVDNDELHKLLEDKDSQINDVSVGNNTKTNIIREQQEEIEILRNKVASFTSQLQNIEHLYRQSAEKIEKEELKYEQLSKERDWWKSEATKLDKECELNMGQLYELKSQVQSTMNNKYKQNNIDIWKKKCHLLYWKRFVEYLIYQHAMEQINDVWTFLKKKYIKLQATQESEKANENTRNVQVFNESFKISMFKSLKDIKNIDIDKLLLCQDAKQLTDFLISSNMTQETQLKVAAQLLPVVETYRIKLQKDINKKIDKFIHKNKNKNNVV